jgi:hypothetical protein
LREVKERRKGGCSTVRQGESWWNDRGERRRGVKDWFLLLWLHGLKSGVTGQTGDGHRSDRCPPMVEPESPYRLFRPTLGRTDDLDKIQQRGLIGRTDVPSVVPTLFFLFEILLLRSSPNTL